MRPVSIIDLTEDLLDADTPPVVNANPKINAQTHPKKQVRPTPSSRLEVLIKDAAKTLQINPQELLDWLDVYLAPEAAQLHLLTMAKRLALNPILGHIDWDHHPDHGFEVFIPIDGWIHLIHREPNFRGIAFSQSTELEHGIPIWMECSINRADFVQPVTVREYFAELKTDHPIWGKMPRRMMRHKTLQQCARLAFGIHLPEYRDQKLIIPAVPSSTIAEPLRHASAKQILKEKLQPQSSP